jgi:hypothetical protein
MNKENKRNGLFYFLPELELKNCVRVEIYVLFHLLHDGGISDIHLQENRYKL